MTDGRLTTGEELPDDMAVRLRARLATERWLPFTDLHALLGRFARNLFDDVVTGSDPGQTADSAYALTRIARGNFADSMQGIPEGERGPLQEAAAAYAGWLGIDLSAPQPGPGADVTAELALDRTEVLSGGAILAAAARARETADTHVLQRVDDTVVLHGPLAGDATVDLGARPTPGDATVVMPALADATLVLGRF